tara:strand:+ start:249 stop:428 length:180 start_codon:yes stop_codon:yes gene_type:complete
MIMNLKFIARTIVSAGQKKSTLTDLLELAQRVAAKSTPAMRPAIAPKEKINAFLKKVQR